MGISAILSLPWWVLLGVGLTSLAVALVLARVLAPLSKEGWIVVAKKGYHFPPLPDLPQNIARWVRLKTLVRGWFRRTVVGLAVTAITEQVTVDGEKSQRLTRKGGSVNVLPPAGEGLFTVDLRTMPYPPGLAWPLVRFSLMVVSVFLALTLPLTAVCGATAPTPVVATGDLCRAKGVCPVWTPAPTATLTPTPTATPTMTPTATATPTPNPTATLTPTATATALPTETAMPKPTAVRIEFLLPALKGKSNIEIAEALISELKSPLRTFSYPELGLAWLNAYGVELWVGGAPSAAQVIWQEVVAIAGFWGLSDAEAAIAANNALCHIGHNIDPVTEGWSFDTVMRIPCQ